MVEDEKETIVIENKPKKPLPKGMIPLNMRSKAEQLKIQSAGGRANKDNPNSKLAARLRELKKKGLKDEDAKWLVDMMTDSEMASLRILEWLKDLQDLSVFEDAKDKNALVKTILDWYKMKHGTKENDRKVAAVLLILTKEEKELEIKRLLTGNV